MASVIGSQDGTYTGMAPGVNIIALKVFADNSEAATKGDITEALNWAVANGATYNVVAVNMSSGRGQSSIPRGVSLGEPICHSSASNAAVVVASGNTYDDFQAPGVY